MKRTSIEQANKLHKLLESYVTDQEASAQLFDFILEIRTLAAQEALEKVSIKIEHLNRNYNHYQVASCQPEPAPASNA